MADGVIIAPDGTAAVLPTMELDPAEASLLRAYKSFLQRRGLREALYCNRCFEGELSDGCEAHVTVTDILIRCRCTLRFFKGAQF